MISSLCKGKSVANPNKCKKVKGCKVASGKSRTFCRKSKNKTMKKDKPAKKAKAPKRRSEVARLKGYNKKTVKALKALA